MSIHLSEQVARGFIDAYVKTSSDPGYAAAGDALAHLLRSAYGNGLVQGVEDLKQKLLAEIAANGPIDEARLNSFTSALFGVYATKG